MNRVVEFIVSLLRREDKTPAVAVAEAKRLQDEQNLLTVQQAILRRDRAAFEELQSVWKAHIPAPTQWSKQDQANLKAFLSSPSGIRFVLRCRTLEYANAIAGCENQLDYTHAAGRVAGCREMLNYILGELAVKHDAPEKEQAPDQRTPEQKEIDELLERVSP